MAEKQVHTERIFVTSEMARRWLRSNIEGNRRVNSNRVNQYARDMKSGKWKENGETLKFADTGELIDGQHRLTASVESGIGFWSLVSYGIKKEAFITIDRNQPRSIGQQLHLAYGATDYNNLQAALTWLSVFVDGIVAATRARPTASELQELFNENPGMQDSVRAAAVTHGSLRTPSRSALAFCHYCFTRQDATLAESFFEALSTGASLRTIDPVFRLRERIITSSAAANKRLSTFEFIALVFKAWQAEKEGRTIEGTLRWQVGESFPNIGPIGTKKRRVEGVIPPVKEAPVKRIGKRGRKYGDGNANSPQNAAVRAKGAKMAKLLAKPLSLDRV